MGKVYAITSGKGGTGKTMFAVNMAAMLAMRGYSVVLLDMDMGLRNIDLYLGLENRVVYNLMDVMSGVCRIRQALIKDRRFGENLQVISASPGRDTRDITPMHMEILCEKLKSKFDFVIIDAPVIVAGCPLHRRTMARALSFYQMRLLRACGFCSSFSKAGSIQSPS